MSDSVEEKSQTDLKSDADFFLFVKKKSSLMFERFKQRKKKCRHVDINVTAAVHAESSSPGEESKSPSWHGTFHLRCLMVQFLPMTQQYFSF